MTSIPSLTSTATMSRAAARSRQRREHLQLLRALQQQARAGDRTVWTQLGNISDTKCKALKALLRERLKSRQKPRCCYCKRWLLNTAYASPIEHVLPRDTYPEFALHMRNLAIACYDCNQLKAAVDWAAFTGSRRFYPGIEAADHFYHPRYHHYDEHIRYMRVESNRLQFVTYHGLTPQGRHLCVNLLSRVVGRESLQRSTPQLAEWLQLVDDVTADPAPPPRPAFEAFRNAIDHAVDTRLKDAGKSGVSLAHL
ncbi:MULTISPECIES: HNH endonuclease [Pseudomonas]|uniref:HNH endonuclease n=1 Tax=Pseudomonas TaxID=286 RepID=UPI000FFC7107|nr:MULTISPECIES: hypothetical protein [Pseudomonas]MDZ3826564.1 hypothetical protein [Pseudomonas monsensis]